jgi:hypothetical protein
MLTLVLLIAGALAFLLAAFNTPSKVNLVAVGLALCVIAVIVERLRGAAGS